MGSRVLVSVALLALLLGACQPLPGPGPVDPDPPPEDAGADVSPPPRDAGEDASPDAGVDDCERAGARLEELQCRDADGLATWVDPFGKRTFADECRDALTRGIDYHPACLATIADCTERNDAARGLLCRDGGAP